MQRKTRQRDAILAALERAGRPLGPNEILELAQTDVPTLGLATVYRTIKSLLDSEEISPVELPGEPARYELRCAADHHHHHFRCRTCEKVFDVTGCPPGLQNMIPPGFVLESHDITLFGLCQHCTSRKPESKNKRTNQPPQRTRRTRGDVPSHHHGR